MDKLTYQYLTMWGIFLPVDFIYSDKIKRNLSNLFDFEILCDIVCLG